MPTLGVIWREDWEQPSPVPIDKEEGFVKHEIRQGYPDGAQAPCCLPMVDRGPRGLYFRYIIVGQAFRPANHRYDR